MQIPKEDKDKIEQLMADMNCPKDFLCFNSEFEVLCKAKDNGVNGYANCLEKEFFTCSFKVTFGHGALCHCPIRVYIAKNLNI